MAAEPCWEPKQCVRTREKTKRLFQEQNGRWQRQTRPDHHQRLTTEGMLQPICLRPSPSTFIYNNRYRCPSLKWGGMENEKKREAECESKRWSAKEGWKSKEEVTILHRYPSPFSRSLSHTPVRRRARCLVKGRLQMSIVSLRCWQRKEDIMRGRKKWQAGRCAARLSCTWIRFYSGTSFNVIFSQVK